MTTGFQQQDQSLNHCFMRSAREPHQVGQKLQGQPQTKSQTPTVPRPAEPRSFR